MDRKKIANSLCQIYGIEPVVCNNPSEYIEEKKREVSKAIRQELHHRDMMAKQYRMAKM